MEYDLGWKTNFDGTQPSMEDNLCVKTAFDGMRPLLKEKFLKEEYLRLKIQYIFDI